MEIFEVINNVLNKKNMTKREFAQKLIDLEPKSNRTGEVISENIVYSYLNGQTAMKAYLIPYISDVLGIPEQFLFDESKKVRKKMLKYLAETVNTEEYEYFHQSLTRNTHANNKLLALLSYAPEPFVKKWNSLFKK
jgi:transcriptional regulator with XRE-family HTH domain